MKRVTIRFPADRPYDYYTQVFWFAENLFSRIVTTGLGQMNDIDHGREIIWIDVVSKRHLGTVMRVVQKELNRSFPGGDATVNVGDSPAA